MGFFGEGKIGHFNFWRKKIWGFIFGEKKIGPFLEKEDLKFNFWRNGDRASLFLEIEKFTTKNNVPMHIQLDSAG